MSRRAAQQQKIQAEQLQYAKQCIFYTRSLDRNDADIAAVLELNRNLTDLKNAIDKHERGELIRLEMGEGALRLATDGRDALMRLQPAAPKENPESPKKDSNDDEDDEELVPVDTSEIPAILQELCVDFLLRRKLRRKLMSRIFRRINRIAASMDGNADVAPPVPPRYGERRLEIDPQDIAAVDERVKQQERALARIQLALEKRRIHDLEARFKAAEEVATKKEVVEEFPSSEETVKPNVEASAEAPEAPSSAPPIMEGPISAEIESSLLKDDPLLQDHKVLQDFKDTYETSMDSWSLEKANIVYNALKAPIKEDYTLKLPGVAATHPNMSLKEKELEFKRWQGTLLTRIPEQPTWDDLGLEHRVFFLKERRKRAMDAYEALQKEKKAKLEESTEEADQDKSENETPLELSESQPQAEANDETKTEAPTEAMDVVVDDDDKAGSSPVDDKSPTPEPMEVDKDEAAAQAPANTPSSAPESMKVDDEGNKQPTEPTASEPAADTKPVTESADEAAKPDSEDAPKVETESVALSSDPPKPEEPKVVEPKTEAPDTAEKPEADPGTKPPQGPTEAGDKDTPMPDQKADESNKDIAIADVKKEVPVEPAGMLAAPTPVVPKETTVDAGTDKGATETKDRPEEGNSPTGETSTTPTVVPKATTGDAGKDEGETETKDPTKVENAPPGTFEGDGNMKASTEPTEGGDTEKPVHSVNPVDPVDGDVKMESEAPSEQVDDGKTEPSDPVAEGSPAPEKDAAIKEEENQETPKKTNSGKDEENPMKEHDEKKLENMDSPRNENPGSPRKEKDDAKAEETAAKILKPISLSAIPSFHEQDVRRTKSVQTDLMSHFLQDNAQRRLEEASNEYNTVFRSARTLLERRVQMQQQLQRIMNEQRNVEQQWNNEYSVQVAIAKNRWLQARRQFDHNRLNNLLPSRQNYQIRGTQMTQTYRTRPDRTGISDQVGQCLGDVVDAVEGILQGILQNSRFTEQFVPPPVPAGFDPDRAKRLKQMEAQTRNETNELAVRISKLEDQRKRSWKKLLKTKADFDIPHEHISSSTGMVKMVQVTGSNYGSIPPPNLQLNSLQHVPRSLGSKRSAAVAAYRPPEQFLRPDERVVPSHSSTRTRQLLSQI